MWNARQEQLDYFVTSADAFHGASGGGLFDAGHHLLGITSRGEQDFLVSDQGCHVVFREWDSEATANEQATYAFRAREGLCGAGGGRWTSCGPDGPARDPPGPAGGCRVTPTGRPAGAGLTLACCALGLLVTRSITRIAFMC